MTQKPNYLDVEWMYAGAHLSDETIAETDFILWTDEAGSLATLDLRNNLNDYIYEYNQGAKRRTRNACTLYSACGTLWDTMGYKFSEDELLEICALAEAKYGWAENAGGYLYKAVDCVRHWWNAKFSDNQIKTYRVELGTTQAERALNKGYSIMCGYKTSPEYFNDTQDNQRVDNKTYSGYTGGHAVRTRIWIQDDTYMSKNVVAVLKWNDVIIDNYFWKKKYNVYENKYIAQLKAHGAFFKWGYVFVAVPKKDEIRDNIPLQDAKELYDKGITNGRNPQDTIPKYEVWALINRIDNKFQKQIKALEDKIQELTLDDLVWEENARIWD